MDQNPFPVGTKVKGIDAGERPFNGVVTAILGPYSVRLDHKWACSVTMLKLDDQTEESMEKVEHWHGDGDPEWEGWYINSYDRDGECYDSIGPYDSKLDAENVLNQTATLDAS